MFFPRSWHVVMGTAVTRILRCVARDHDFSVRNGRLMTRHEQSLKSSRAHEQLVKTHEHFSKLMSNRWKAMSKIPREKCSWGFQNPHEPSWGLMRTHEFLMRTHEFLMRSSWGKNSSRLFFVRDRALLGCEETLVVLSEPPPPPPKQLTYARTHPHPHPRPHTRAQNKRLSFCSVVCRISWAFSVATLNESLRNANWCWQML